MVWGMGGGGVYVMHMILIHFHQLNGVKPLSRESSGSKVSSCMYAWLVGLPAGGASPHNDMHCILLALACRIG